MDKIYIYPKNQNHHWLYDSDTWQVCFDIACDADLFFDLFFSSLFAVL